MFARYAVEKEAVVCYNIGMKFFHLSDLHLGKRVNEFSMLEDQQYILGKICQMAAERRPAAVVIAGDVYDRPVPPVEAVKLFDGFLCSLTGMGIKVLVAGGNHDSSDRLSFAARLMEGSGVYIAPSYGGEMTKVPIADEYGTVNFYLLPFIKPAVVSHCFPEEQISGYTRAVEVAIARAGIDFGARNVLVAHQFVTGASRCESEEISVGGTDNVDADVFKDFNYVALGHIHGPQNVAKNARYCGTPLKYSFSEASHKKSVTEVTLDASGQAFFDVLPLIPRRDWKVLKGEYLQVTSAQSLKNLSPDDYYKVILTDEEDIPEGMAKLRFFFPNIMAMEYDNARTRAAVDAGEAGDVRGKSPLELFKELYFRQNGRQMTERMEAMLTEIMDGIGGERQ